MTKTRTLRFSAAVLLALAVAAPAAALVKESSSGICHDPDSPWFEQTQNFDAYDTMSGCLEDGRAYSGYDGAASPESGSSDPSGPGTEYDRDLYGDWADFDGDCMNTRHELLAELSTSRVSTGDRGCYVQRGRWNDPYTGKVFLDPGKMDVDHMVPLAWAHYRGGYDWSPEKRETFANDMVNLFAVESGPNRSKGADGPLDWMPPNTAFHCQYVTRFHRIVLKYDLEYLPGEAEKMAALRERVCG